MKRRSLLSWGAACLVLASPAHAAEPVSYFPKSGLGQFLAQNFDLASIRSSLGPRRTPAQRTFADFGMKPSKATDETLVFDQAGHWLYQMDIVGRRDVNGDGIEDLEVCFLDRARNGGSYHASQGLLVSRYSADSYALALNFKLQDGLCREYAR